MFTTKKDIAKVHRRIELLESEMRVHDSMRNYERDEASWCWHELVRMRQEYQQKFDALCEYLGVEITENTPPKPEEFKKYTVTKKSRKA